ncbi:MAG TPA: hypothetical protein VJO53_02155 [Candidatus Acidoferrales bacterium]|nr:hypothetical protein [Candidatus Acidoferrales bacterium]
MTGSLIVNDYRTATALSVAKHVERTAVLTSGASGIDPRALHHRKSRLFKWCLVLALTLIAVSPALGQTYGQPGSRPNRETPEDRAARAFETAKSNPLELRAFLAAMPKGADLHIHLSGAVYAETWIRDGAEDRLCVNPASLSFAPRPPSTGGDASQSACEKGDVPASRALQDQHLYDALVDSFSMRGFVPSAGVTGHDHFFDTFSKFSGVDQRHTGEWLDEVAARAAAQNEQYLELMVTPPFTHALSAAYQLAWRDDGSLAEFREQLLSRGLRDDIAVARAYLDQAEQTRRQREHCGEPDPSAACAVELRYIYQVLRAFPKPQAFAQTLLGFEIASADPRFVGINYVQPEDGFVAMSDYAAQMRFLEFLRGVYPKVHLTLHAGELAPGMVPPDGLCCHIRLAVEQAHAERIGHGVDIMYEERPYDLLKEMAAKHVLVEINLTSNDLILGVGGKDHPFPIYRKFRVPVGISTDDEGVSRIDLTHEYVRAVETYGLTYADLKQLLRATLEHSFLPGASLWREADGFDRTISSCSQDTLGADKPAPACAKFLQSSEKSRQQWELERRFRVFESSR